MRISIAALYGFCPGTPKDAELPGTALLMEGDETVLTFTKRDMYAGWTTEENVRQMQQMLGQWLRGEVMDITK